MGDKLTTMEKSKTIVNINNVVTRLPELRFAEPFSWEINEGEQWAIVGPNGAGKTLIADLMQRKFYPRFSLCITGLYRLDDSK